MAGSISEIARLTLEADFRNINPVNSQVILVEAGERVLASFKSELSIDAKKDFAVGEAAMFGDFEVTANSVKPNYIPEESFYAPNTDEEYVLINVSVKNTSIESEPFSSFELSLNADGVSETSYFVKVSPAFEGGTLSPNAVATGNLVYKISKGTEKLKLQYESIVYDTTDYTSKTLTYTLGL
jgi:hypothetical protein